MGSGQDVPPSWRAREQWNPGELLELRDVEWSPPWGRPGGSIEHARALLEEHLGEVEGVVVRDVDNGSMPFRRDPPELEVRRDGVLVGRIECFPFDVLRFRGTRADGMRLEGEVHGLIRFVPRRALVTVNVEPPDDDDPDWWGLDHG